MSTRLHGVAWMLMKSPYMSAGGRTMHTRYFRVLVVGPYVVTSFNVIERQARMTVNQYGSPESAQANAVWLTTLREQEGFVLAQGPLSLPIGIGKEDALSEKIGFKGYDEVLDLSLDKILSEGAPLAA